MFAHWRRKIDLALTGLCCLLLASCLPEPAHPQSSDFPELTRDELSEVCSRPYPPDPSHYESAAAFDDAKEQYYRAASVYVSDCIDRWITESRRMYEEMFRAEAEAYQRDRQDVLDKMRDAAQSRF